jgi:hypothetical protein
VTSPYSHAHLPTPALRGEVLYLRIQFCQMVAITPVMLVAAALADAALHLLVIVVGLCGVYVGLFRLVNVGQARAYTSRPWSTRTATSITSNPPSPTS